MVYALKASDRSNVFLLNSLNTDCDYKTKADSHYLQLALYNSLSVMPNGDQNQVLILE